MKTFFAIKVMMMKKKFGAHTHFTPHMFTKCCNITTTVNNAATTNNTNSSIYKVVSLTSQNLLTSLR